MTKAAPAVKWETPRARREGGALFVHVPIEPPGLNGKGGQLRSHWAARKRVAKKIEDMLALALSGVEKQPPLPRARIEYMRSYSAQPMDEDNLAASAKPVLDALQRLGVIRSDAPEHLELPPPRQTKRAGRGPFFQLKIEAVA